MLESRQTLSFWQPKKRLLKLARATRRPAGQRPACHARAVARRRTSQEPHRRRRQAQGTLFRAL